MSEARSSRPVAPPVRRILILQRNVFVARSLSRYLSRKFEQVFVASSTDEAELILRDPDRCPTDLVCGHHLDETGQSSLGMIRRWRKAHPTLERVILATGTEHIPADLEGVDAVLLKPAHATELITLLG